LKNSARAFKLCIEEAKYTNLQLRRHYEEVLSALQPILKKEAQDAELLAKTEIDARKAEEGARKAEEEKMAQALYERRQKYQWAIVGVIVVVLFVGYWQAREILRRAQSRRKKSAKQLGPVD
jgi:hypothetical protein